jgi:nitrogen PTS system EIIA component
MPTASQGSGFAGLVVAGGLIPELPALAKDAALLALARHAATLVDQSALLIHERLRTR